MRSQSFKEVLASSGSDKARSPALSRAERLEKAVPPAVAELLERRRLFASFVLSGGILTVTGTDNADSLLVYMSGGNVYVDDGPNTHGPYGVTSRVKVFGRGGDDTIEAWIGGTFDLAYPAEFYGEDGDDTLGGSTVGDHLEGGAGYDLLNGSDGDDDLLGGDENDTLNGDNGNDQLYGGALDDVLNGGDANDELVGEGGDDTLDGGANSDTLYGGAGDDRLTGGPGTDTMYGDDDDDVFFVSDQTSDYVDGGNGSDSLGDTPDVTDTILNV